MMVGGAVLIADNGPGFPGFNDLVIAQGCVDGRVGVGAEVPGIHLNVA
jgi:hypothetical protein